MRRLRRSGASERLIATGSVFSTLLIEHVIRGAAPAGVADLLVDVGSGDSPYRDVIAHRRYLGIDRRPTGRDATVIIGDVANLPLATGIADALLCTEVIEHVPDEHALAAELARVSRPGAQLLLSAPFVHGLHEQPYDFRRLTSIGLTATIEAAGWYIESLRPIGGPVVVTIDSLVRWGDSLLGRILRRVPIRPVRRSALRTSVSGGLQTSLAALTLRCNRNFAPIDPAAASPRITLGYVLTATRSSSSSLT